jgi:hypothetical protein
VAIAALLRKALINYQEFLQSFDKEILARLIYAH